MERTSRFRVMTGQNWRGLLPVTRQSRINKFFVVFTYCLLNKSRRWPWIFSFCIFAETRAINQKWSWCFKRKKRMFTNSIYVLFVWQTIFDDFFCFSWFAFSLSLSLSLLSLFGTHDMFTRDRWIRTFARNRPIREKVVRKKKVVLH